LEVNIEPFKLRETTRKELQRGVRDGGPR